MCSGSLAIASAPEIQERDVAICTTPPRIPSTPESRKKAVVNYIAESLFKHGLYSKLVDKLSPQLDSAQTPDTKLLYLRGVAAWQVGLFDQADKDLSRIGDFKPFEDWAAASSYTKKFRAMKAILPSRVSEIRLGGKTRFRVFSSKESAWSSAIIDTLPQAYEINSTITKREPPTTQVFIFERYEDFKTFYKLRSHGTAPGSWVWAAGDASIMFFCRNVPGASPNVNKINSDYFRTTIVHEYNHALVNAISGNAPMPIWLREGLATVIQSRASNVNATSLRQRMQQVVDVKAFLPLKEMSSKQVFVKNTEEYVAKSRQHIASPDPYPQAGFMVNYLLSLFPPDDLEVFLIELGFGRPFDETFQKHTHRTLEQFYQEWLTQIPNQLNDGSTNTTKYALLQNTEHSELGIQTFGNKSVW